MRNRIRFSLVSVGFIGALVACSTGSSPRTSGGLLGNIDFGYQCDDTVDDCSEGYSTIPSSVAVGASFAIRYFKAIDYYYTREAVPVSGAVESIGTHVRDLGAGHFLAVSEGLATLVVRGVNDELIDFHPMTVEDVASLALGTETSDDEAYDYSIIIRTEGDSAKTLPRLTSASQANDLPQGTYRVAVYPKTVDGRTLAGALTYDVTSSDSNVVLVNDVGNRFITFSAKPGDAIVTISAVGKSVAFSVHVSGDGSSQDSGTTDQDATTQHDTGAADALADGG